MTKKLQTDRRPYEVRPVSLIRLGQAKSQGAPDNLSRYEEISRQFAQEFSQAAWNFEQHLRKPFFLSSNTGQQGNKPTAPSNDATVADSSAGSYHGMANDSSGFATLTGYNISIYGDDDCFDALPLAMTTASASRVGRLDNADTPAPPNPDVGFGSSCDLEMLTSQLLRHNQDQESRYNRRMQTQNTPQGGKQWDRQRTPIPEAPVASPVERTWTGDDDNKAFTEASRLGRDKMDQIMIDLDQLGTRLLQDARRQLDVISGSGGLS